MICKLISLKNIQFKYFNNLNYRNSYSSTQCAAVSPQSGPIIEAPQTLFLPSFSATLRRSCKYIYFLLFNNLT